MATIALSQTPDRSRTPSTTSSTNTMGTQAISSISKKSLTLTDMAGAKATAGAANATQRDEKNFIFNVIDWLSAQPEMILTTTRGVVVKLRHSLSSRGSCSFTWICDGSWISDSSLSWPRMRRVPIFQEANILKLNSKFHSKFLPLSTKLFAFASAAPAGFWRALHDSFGV